jgi:hypothetical protein
MVSRINNNNYVMSRMSGPKELLYVESMANYLHYVAERPRRSQDCELNAKYTSNTPNKHYIHNKEIFDHSLAVMSKLGSTESIEAPRRRITRIQFGPQHTIKWAIYKADGVIYFAPYAVGYSSISDILVKQLKSQKPHLATITFEPTMALDADLSGANQE